MRLTEGLEKVRPSRVPVVVGIVSLGQIGRVRVVVPAKVPRAVVVEVRVLIHKTVGRLVVHPLVTVSLEVIWNLI